MPHSRPNLLFVFPDEWRRAALGANGTDPVLTPVLDEFARSSRVLNNAVSNCPICSPYRGMLMTGQYPYSSGVVRNCNTQQPDSFLRPDARCFSDVLHDAGYHCGYVGKWHLEHPRAPYVEEPRKDGKVWDEWTAPQHRHGFDFWHSYGVKDHHFKPHYWTNQTPREAPLRINQWSPIHETDVAIEYLRNQGGQHRDDSKPFALMVSMNPPHMPFEQVPAQYVECYGDATPQDLLVRGNVDLSSDNPFAQTAREQVKNYFAACSGVDEQFGRILAALDEQGLADNTIVVFTSDHGEMMGSHDLMYKAVFYEESIGVPFMIRWPKHIPIGVDDLLLSAPDLMPTLLGLLGLGECVPASVEGRNLSRALLGKDGERPEGALCITKSPDSQMEQTRAWRTHNHLFAIDKTPQGRKNWLFDLRDDPFQMNNVAAHHVDLCAQLEREMSEQLELTGDPWLARSK